MNPHDPFETWKRARRGSGVPEGFADRVMDSLRERHPPIHAVHRPRSRRIVSVLTLAAAAGIAVVCQAVLVGAFLLTWTETAH